MRSNTDEAAAALPTQPQREAGEVLVRLSLHRCRPRAISLQQAGGRRCAAPRRAQRAGPTWAAVGRSAGSNLSMCSSRETMPRSIPTKCSVKGVLSLCGILDRNRRAFSLRTCPAAPRNPAAPRRTPPHPAAAPHAVCLATPPTALHRCPRSAPSTQIIFLNEGAARPLRETLTNTEIAIPPARLQVDPSMVSSSASISSLSQTRVGLRTWQRLVTAGVRLWASLRSPLQAPCRVCEVNRHTRSARGHPLGGAVQHLVGKSAYECGSVYKRCHL
jgi:hypothetical protein